jgi:hypothetical protein
VTTHEALDFVLRTDAEDRGPESYEDAVELFRALHDGMSPDPDDDILTIWSHVCATATTIAKAGRYEVLVSAKRYEDDDDCFAAVIRDVARAEGVEPWQCTASWEDDDTRDHLLVLVEVRS